MKLLGWMHRKFRQNSSETPKEFSINGQQYLEGHLQYCNPKGSNNYGYRKSLTKHHNFIRNSFTSFEAATDHDDLEEEDEGVTDHLTELFHGFLAIGTLGTEPLTATDHPQTPTFPNISTTDHEREKISSNQSENEEALKKMINEELEKVLGADRDSTRSSCNLSSGRNSHVSAGRISHCSAITIGGKPIMESDSGDHNQTADICPLQSYLLGSAAVGVPAVKREQRTSLGELFQKSKQFSGDENLGGSTAGKSKGADKESALKHVVKKMLRKRRNSGGSMDTTETTKLHKILQVFNRRVHPENCSSNCRQSHHHKPTKNEMKNNINNNNNHWMESNGGLGLRPSAEDIIIYPHRAGISKERAWKVDEHSAKSSSRNIAENEFWVKTDADYLVLEL